MWRTRGTSRHTLKTAAYIDSYGWHVAASPAAPRPLQQPMLHTHSGTGAACRWYSHWRCCCTHAPQGKRWAAVRVCTQGGDGDKNDSAVGVLSRAHQSTLPQQLRIQPAARLPPPRCSHHDHSAEQATEGIRCSQQARMCLIQECLIQRHYWVGNERHAQPQGCHERITAQKLGSLCTYIQACMGMGWQGGWVCAM